MPSNSNLRNQRLHRSSQDSDDEISHGKDQYCQGIGAEELICCIHGKPCELKDQQLKRLPAQQPRMTVVDKPIRIISISPAAYDSPYSPAITASSEETGYENLESLNGQTVAMPIQSSSASGGSDDNQYNYDESSTDDIKACYEPISKDVDAELVYPKPIEPIEVASRELHKTMYLGEKSRAMAEAACKKKASFLLYNRFPSGHSRVNKHMPPHLPLFIVYRTSVGDYCHYRIVDKDVMGSKSPSQFNAPRRQHHLNEYRVDISGEPYFSSLKALVSYYLTYVMVSKEGATDIFPWWRTKSEYLNRADIYADSK